MICTPFSGQPEKGVIFMRYTNEFKLNCVEMYYKGKYPDTPEGLSDFRFHKTVRGWVRLYESGGEDALFHKPFNKDWSNEKKYELVSRVLAGEQYATVAISSGINPGQLYQWVQRYKIEGYNGLNLKRGRKSTNSTMNKKTKPRELTESEYEELIRLRAENEYIKAENEVIKKQIALRHEKWAAELKAKKQQSSRNLEKKDTN